MKSGKIIIAAVILAFTALICVGIIVSFLTPPKPIPVQAGTIPPNTYEPAVWGKIYPLEYDSWMETSQPKPTGKSRYKKGWDSDLITYDKLSEFPYMALLFKGWGFAVEYNEPRGHHFAVIDQVEIDKSRTAAGGACLTCKTPYISKLVKEHGTPFHKMPFFEARDLIPEPHRNLGPTCFDCHDNETMDLAVHRWTIQKGLKTIGNPNPTHQDMRSVVCGQCHCTYYVKKTPEMKSMDVIFPWSNSQWGHITIENIIQHLLSDPSHLEWKQEVTGYKMAFIRHPEFEFFTNQSPHFQGGLSCADCHMPYKRVGSNKISDHNMTSPLKNDMRACMQCHTSTAEEMRNQVLTIQDRTISMMKRAGYATSIAAKLIEMTHKAQAEGTTIEIQLYEKAKEAYLQAFYRVTFIGAENSIGFHNPAEAGRMSSDAIAFAGKSEALLRQLLTQAGVDVPANVNLELAKYVNNRGTKEKAGTLNFKPEQEFKDPTGNQEHFTPRDTMGF